MAEEFKQCPNGHYYQGVKCPYCRVLGFDGVFADPGFRDIDDVRDIIDINHSKKNIQPKNLHFRGRTNVCGCHNNHLFYFTYDVLYQKCPYCGALSSFHNQVLPASFVGNLQIQLYKETSILASGNAWREGKRIEISKYASCIDVTYCYYEEYKMDYELFGEYLSLFETIRIGDRTFSRYGFIKLIDVMIGVKEIENHQ